MKKVLIVTPEFGKGKGGIQNWMYYLHKLLNLHGFSLGVYAYKENNIFIKLSLLLKSELYILATWKMSLFIFPIIFFAKRKIFIFIHGDEILNLNTFQWHWLKKLSSDKNIHWIANSHAVSDIFLQQTKREADFIQTPFLDTKVDVFQKSENFIPMFFTISRLVKRKNIDSVIKALYELSHEGIKFNYIIAGEGKEKKNLMDLVKKLSMDSMIQILGKIDELEKDTFLKKSDYFLLPSIFEKNEGSIEGYGIVFIEANAYGIPVLSGDTGGMLEAVVDGVTGYHCDGSVDNIKLNIKKMMKTSFDEKTIRTHAYSHHYKNQIQFIDFIKRKIDE